jgi:membrane fusion protein (multidrug efflux system)
MTMRRFTILISLAGVIAAGACARGAGEGEGSTPRLVTGVRTAMVAEQAFSEVIDATGIVSGRPGHVAVLSAPSVARIASVSAVVGQRVAPGTVLVELDQVAFRAAAQSADAALAMAERQAARSQRLVDAGIAPRRDLDLATAELAAAKATAETTRRQSDLSVLRSPIAGVVTQVSATLGATADPSQPLVQVTDGSAVDIVFNLAPAQAEQLRAGARVELLGAPSAPGAAIRGEAKVVAVGGAVDSATRAVAVRAALQGSGQTLKIGETIAARIILATRAHALVVPLEALVPEGEGFKVFVVDSAGTARARQVAVGGRTGTVAEITDGLKLGETVVTYGAYGMDDSVKVAPPAPAARKPAAK